MGDAGDVGSSERRDGEARVHGVELHGAVPRPHEELHLSGPLWVRSHCVEARCRRVDVGGVAQPRGRTFVFATGDSIPDGAITGSLVLETAPLGGGVVEACAKYMLPIIRSIVDADALAGFAADAIRAAQAETDRPSLICVRSHIGYGAPTK